MTKRLLKSSVIFIILALFVLLWIALYAPQNISAYADEPSLPSTYWTASSSLAGNGWESAPYIISSPQDFAYLASAVNAGNSFENAYFSLSMDLDMSGYLTMPIGSYTGVNNQAFNGVFEGNGYTLSGLTINRSSDNTALFSYIGNKAVVRNFTIAQDSIIIGANRYTASVVGRCMGIVEGVLSFADVRGDSPIGGIVGNNYQGQVVNCVFAGSLTGSASKYGIEGMNNNGTGSGSWYVTDNFGYTHNSRGNVLYADTNGSLATDIVSGEPTFTLTPDTGFQGQVRTADESVVSEGATFVPVSGLNDARYFVRFVKTITISAQLNGTALGAGTYYEGQTVKIKIAPNEGYYFDNITSNVTPLDNASYTNDVDNSVIYSFPMPDADVSFDVIFNEFAPGAGAISTDFVYDGNSKVATTEERLQQSNEAYQDFSFTINCLCPIQGTLPTFAHKAGQYSVMITISKYIESSLIIIGRVEHPYTIDKAQLEITDPSLFPSSKQYDNLSTFTLPVADNYEVIGADIVTMTASVTYYTDANLDIIAYAIGENCYYAAYVFSISGEHSNNYLQPESVVVPNASITRRIALVSIDERFLTKVFNETPPSVQAYSVDSVGAIDIEFIFTHVSKPESIYDVGEYTVAVQFKEDVFNPNNDNHTLLLEEEYTYEIAPMPVSVSFSGYNNLIYTGSQQAITALHGTVYAGISIPANIVYKMDGDVVPLLNAGSYIAYAYPLNLNYELVGIVTCEFSVAKINQSDDLCIDQVEDTTYNIQPISLTTTGGDGDGVVTYTLVSGKATISEDVLTLYGAGEIKIQATKAESQNYFQISSGVMSFYVSKASLTVAVTNAQNHITYNDILELPLTYSGFVDGEEHLVIPLGLERPTIKLTVDGSTYTYEYNTNIRLDASEIGYPIILSGGASDGYEIVADNSGEPMLFVAKKALTVRANHIQKIYGQNDPVLAYTIDEGVFALSGTLIRESGNDVGEYDISLNTLTDANNPNFIITFYPNIFTITKANLTIRPNSTQKAYGEQDPVVEFQVIGLVYTDIAQIEINREEGESPGFYPYVLAAIMVNDNYNIVFNDLGRGLTINTILPIVTKLPSTSTIIYGNGLGSSNFSGGIVKAVTNEGEMTITGVYLWEEDITIIPSVSDSGVALFAVRFIPDDEVSYRQITFDCSITVSPLALSVEYQGAAELAYNGQVQKQVQAQPVGVLEGDDIGFSYHYSGDMINAGVYQVIPTINNPNYILAPNSEYQVSIAKKVLRIGLEPVSYNDDKVPKPVFTYIGFVAGEDESALSKLPLADMPDKAGTYNIAPYGAAADNYNITYTKSNIVVKQSVLYTTEESIVAIGSYDANISFDATIFAKGNGQEQLSEFVEGYKEFKQGSQQFSGLSLKGAYHFSFMRDGKEVELEEPITIRIQIPNSLAHARSLEVLYYNEDGEMQVVQGATVDGQYLVIVTDKMGDYVVVANNDYTIFVIIIAIVGLSALFIFLDAGFRRRKKSKASQFDYQKRTKNAYRQAKRDKKSLQKLEKINAKEKKIRGRQFRYVTRDDIY